LGEDESCIGFNRVFNNRLTWALLAFAVAGAPLPFGSTDPFMVAFWCVILGTALVICRFQALRSVHAALLALSAAIVLAFGFVLHEQISSAPWIATPHPLWAEAAKALDESIPARAAIAKNQPFFSVGGPLLAMLTLTTSFVVGTDRILAWRLFRTVAWIGAAYALYSIAAFLIEPAKVLWREKVGHLHSLTGTFTNRNTAADFFGTCSILWLLLALEKIRKLLPRDRFSLTEAGRHVLNNADRELAISVLMLLLCLAAMFLTASRAGVLLSLAALLLAAACVYRRVMPPAARTLSILLAVGTAFLLLVQVMGAGVSNRLDLEGVADSGRIATYRSTLQMIEDRPWFGTGLGTFEMAYPAYRSGEISMAGIWNRAHNSLLETTSDLGIPLTAVIASGWLVVVARLVLGVVRRRRDVYLPAAGLAVCFLGLTHSLVDFSLQIPGYAVLFYSMVGMGLAQSFASGEAAAKPDGYAADLASPRRMPTSRH
jgi:O-antigen ligase